VFKLPKISDFDHGRYLTKKDKKRAEKIPGMADWIKSKEKIKKHAFIGEEEYAGRTLGMEDHNRNRIQRRAEEIAKEIKGRKMKKHAFTKQRTFKDDPFRTTKTVAEVEVANHALNFLTDVGAAAVTAAAGVSGASGSGGFKDLYKLVKTKGFRGGFKQIKNSPLFKEDLKKMLKAQKIILPIGVGITAAYVGKALRDDFRHKRMRDMNTFKPVKMKKNAADRSHDRELSVFVRAILGDKRPDSKYNPVELKMGIKVEHEHTKSSFVAKKIAKDHLDEIPDYYTRLKFLEELAKKQMGKKG
jgi:hypothetical protein